jgi:cell fate (sporulation/competence/biofilm development) regulator YlbF (YheA/YmcA/DUF963 family)
MSIAKQAGVNGVNLEAAALDAARALALAIGESPSFKAFEAAQEALMADREVNRRLQDYQRRQQEVWFARTWGGGDSAQEAALEEEWRALSQTPTLRAYLQAQESLTDLLRAVAGVISQEIGIDYGAACAPAGGCC